MKATSLKIHVSESLGDVSAEIFQPKKMEYMLTLAHGAGAGMKHPFMITLSNELAALDIGTLRFNFPFAELKKKRPDVPAIAHKTIEAAILKAKKLFPSTPIFSGGKSFGGRMTSQYLSKQESHSVKGYCICWFPIAPSRETIR